MTSESKRKGDRAELQIAALIADELGYSVRRKLGAGRADDTGDLDGIPNTTAQVAFWDDTLRAYREKPLAAEVQRANAGDLLQAFIDAAEAAAAAKIGPLAPVAKLRR